MAGWFPIDGRIGRANQFEFKTITGFGHEYTRVKLLMFFGSEIGYSGDSEENFH